MDIKRIIDKLLTFFKALLHRMFITLQLYFENGVSNHAAACAFGFLLSMAPMLLLLSFFIYFTFKAAPGTITALISTIPFLGGIFDEKWLSSDFFSFYRPSIPGFISVVSIIWAGRILALSIQRGLRNIFPSAIKKTALKNTIITLIIEVSVIIFVLVIIISSRTAMRFYPLFDFLPRGMVVRFVTSHFGGQVFSINLLGLASFSVYIMVPAVPPKKYSAFIGALFCTLAYFFTVLVLGIIINRARYNFLYGTFGNLIIILVNVYFFFTFFFIGAQLAFVTDYYDALLFSSLRKTRKKEAEKRKTGFTNKLRPYYLLCKFFNPAKSNLSKYLRCYKKDEIIFSQRETAGFKDDVYYILEGEIEILISSTDGSSFSGNLKTDSFFELMGNMLFKDRNVIVTAKTSVVVIVLPFELFNEILKYDTTIDRVLVDHISRRLKKITDPFSKTANLKIGLTS